MTHQTLKYGTRVLVGLVVTGATIYTTTRLQVKPVDVIEIMEGVRERQMIVSTITQTNVFGLQIASNLANLVQLDADIATLIPNFVNQHKISGWLADRPDTNPVPRWTKIDLLTYLEIGDGTNFTRTPAGATTNNTATFGAWPIQIYATDLKERYAVLQKLTYTTSAAQWHSNNVYDASWGGCVYSNSVTTNFAHGLGLLPCSSNQAVADDVYARIPDWFEESETNTYGNYSPALPGSPTSYASGLAPAQTNNAWISSDSGGGTYFANYIAKLRSPNTYSYEITKVIVGNSWARKIESSMKSTAVSNCLERVDYYYADNALFESISVSSNTLSSFTTNYVSAPALDAAYAEIIVGYDMTPFNSNYYSSCIGGELFYINKYSYGQDQENDGGGLQKGIIPALHEWKVTRCVP